MAPASFGVYGGDLLVGNFGSGRIDAYQPVTTTHFAYKGQLRVATGAPITLDGLWAIAFGNDWCGGSQHQPVLRSRPDRREARALRHDQRRLTDASQRAAAWPPAGNLASTSPGRRDEPLWIRARRRVA